jgi:serine/threonine-protein kinase
VSEERPEARASAGLSVTEQLLERYVEAREARGERLDPADLCVDRPELLTQLRALVERYERLERALAPASSLDERPLGDAPLPSFPGFRTLERLGRGGSSEVYKLEDLTLGRVVAAKVLRSDNAIASGIADFLREARSLAFFEDPRVVRLLEYLPGDPPVLLMEFASGFPLDEIGRSLEYTQRARLLADVADALERAHALGFQHRDLKPGHILVDARLRPKILDFGLARGEPDRGHGIGTLAYMAPEQLDPGRPIDARTDVYALGVVLYELLCGALPFAADTEQDLVAAIRTGEPALPAELETGVPEPLQAIALRAMARDPADRYPSAREMAADLRRFVEGRPVLARPASYRSALGRRLHQHLEQVADWERLRLIYPHEGERLRAAYRRLESREDDWIVGSRVLSPPQIALYLGAFLLACGSLLYLSAYLKDAVRGLLHPTLSLLVPFVLLSALADRLYRREQQAVAIAFHLGASALLPLLLLILFREAGLFVSMGAGAERELFERVSNRQLQVSLLLACGWLAWLAARTRTVALASGFAALLLVLHLALLGDFGLRRWLEEERFDRLALHLVPLIVLAAGLGLALERRGCDHFAQPLYLGSAGLYVLALELLALDGRALSHLGLALRPPEGETLSDPLLLDTVAAMAINGVLVYAAAALVERHGTALMRTPARFLFALSPFAILEPIAYLNHVGEYSRRYLWLYLALALGIAFLSWIRQRRSFYYAGLLNTGLALFLITDRYDWYDRPAWALAVLAVGAALLGSGFGLDLRERARRIRG